MTHAQIDFSKLKVLLLEDSKNMSTLIEAILQAYGCTNIVQVYSVSEALRALDGLTVDLAIVDWFMEPVQGIEFVRQIRAGTGRTSVYLPILMLTGHSEAHRVREARDAGVNDFIVKPVSGLTIYQRIGFLVDQTRPFIRTRAFFGPDRRRGDIGPPRNMADRRLDSLRSGI